MQVLKILCRPTDETAVTTCCIFVRRGEENELVWTWDNEKGKPQLHDLSNMTHDSNISTNRNIEVGSHKCWREKCSKHLATKFVFLTKCLISSLRIVNPKRTNSSPKTFLFFPFKPYLACNWNVRVNKQPRKRNRTENTISFVFIAEISYLLPSNGIPHLATQNDSKHTHVMPWNNKQNPRSSLIHSGKLFNNPKGLIFLQNCGNKTRISKLVAANLQTHT